MPKYKTIIWDDYRISLKPRGLRHIFGWLPYLSGSDVRLTLCVRTKSKQKRDFTCELKCVRFDGNQNNFIESLSGSWIPDKTPTAKYTEEIREYLVTYGEYIFDIRIIESPQISKWFTIDNFSILERDKIVPYIIWGVFLLIIGAGLTLLVQWIIKLLTSQSP